MKYLKAKKGETKCKACGGKVYPIFIKEREMKFTKPRYLKDFYYCKYCSTTIPAFCIQRITRKLTKEESK